MSGDCGAVRIQRNTPKKIKASLMTFTSVKIVGLLVAISYS